MSEAIQTIAKPGAELNTNGHSAELLQPRTINLDDILAVTSLIERVQQGGTKEVIDEGKKLGLQYIEELDALVKIADAVAISKREDVDGNIAVYDDIFDGVVVEEDDDDDLEQEDPLFCDRILKVHGFGLMNINEFLESRKVRGFCRYQASKFYLSNGRDDLIQAAYFGAAKAFRDFSPDKGSFWSFVELCILRQVITDVKTANRQKHQVLNNAESFDHTISPSDHEDSMIPYEAIANPDSHEPVDILIAAESLHDVVARIDGDLSPLERFCFLAHYVTGLSYEEISRIIIEERPELLRFVNSPGSAKTVDNAIQRVKKKISLNID